MLHLIERAGVAVRSPSPARRKKIIEDIIDKTIAAHPQMGILYVLRDEIKSTKILDVPALHALTRKITADLSKQQENTAMAFAGVIAPKARIITLSFSSAVAAALLRAAPKKIEVVIAESRPKNEGRVLARTLQQHGVISTLIVDAAMGLHVPECDVVLLGADAVTPEFFINKIGSLSLCLLAREYGVPVYVVTDPFRLVNRGKLPRRQINHSAAEIIAGRALFAVDNRYFDFVPLKLVDRIFCNGEILTVRRLFRIVTGIELRRERK